MKWIKKRFRRLYREWQIGKTYTQAYPSAGNDSSNRPAIIHVLNNQLQHGGLLDRIKGIVSSYQLAQYLGYDFFMYIDTSTFDLYRFIQPCLQSFVSTEKHIVWNSRYAKPVYLMDHRPHSLADLAALFKKGYKQYHVYSNQDYTDLIKPALSKEAHRQVWSQTFHTLFKFSDTLVARAESSLPKNRTMVGIHGRFMNLLGDFRDTIDGSLDQQSAEVLLQQCMQYTKEVVQQHPDAFFIVVSDSGIFLNMVKDAAPTLGIADRFHIDTGNIAHIDFNHAPEVLEKTVFDFYLLTRCQQVYQLVAQGMYLSQYARYATFIANAQLIRLPNT